MRKGEKHEVSVLETVEEEGAVMLFLSGNAKGSHVRAKLLPSSGGQPCSFVGDSGLFAKRDSRNFPSLGGTYLIFL